MPRPLDLHFTSQKKHFRHSVHFMHWCTSAKWGYMCPDVHICVCVCVSCTVRKDMADKMCISWKIESLVLCKCWYSHLNIFMPYYRKPAQSTERRNTWLTFSLM